MTLPTHHPAADVGLVTAVWRSVPALTRPGLHFGVAVPPDRTDEPAILRPATRFARAVLARGAADAALAAPLVASCSTPQR